MSRQSRTSGDATAPFKSPGQIDPDLMHWVPATGGIVFHDQETEVLPGAQSFEAVPDAAYVVGRDEAGRET